VSIENISGFIPFIKDKGLSSNQAIQSLKKRLKLKKVGHCGTLDPIADGILPVVVNRVTRTARYFLRYKKRYVTTIRFGIETDTQDISGRILSESSEVVYREDIERVLGNFMGGYRQKTPLFSARKYKGRTLYEYARRGVEVPVTERFVHIYEITLTRFEFPFAELDIVCGGGTYIRQLITDICRMAQTIGVMQSLTRTEYGVFNLQNSKRIDELNLTDIIPIEKVFSDFGRFVIRPEFLSRARNGHPLKEDACDSLVDGSFEEFLGFSGEGVVGIYRRVEGEFKPEVILSG
jgi:tRNA pseudouridine55 synthase